jgi:hypothetical protein
MLFSERQGITPPKSVIQINSMDDDLRNGLWNSFCLFYLHKIPGDFGIGSLLNVTRFDNAHSEHVAMDRLVNSLWENLFKKPYDEIRYQPWHKIRNQLRETFFSSEWYEVYNFLEFDNFLEFVVQNYENKYAPTRNNDFIESANAILECELSGYRFVSDKIAPITSHEEISSIEKALEDTHRLNPVYIHLKTALDLFADRKSPDYRNSIKESISGVEALCVIITNNEKSTLGAALRDIEKRNTVHLHTSLKQSFEKLYGYTSDAQGIRHALGLLEEPNLDSEDAKFMLVSCSAFINYLIIKASKAGINL